MNTLASKLSAVVAALILNGLIMASAGYLFEMQSDPHLSVVAFARQLVAHQWII